MNKILFALSFIVIFIDIPRAQIWNGDIYLSSQSEVDAFADDYGSPAIVAGDLIVGNSTAGQYSEIVDLSPLASIHSVWGSVVIFQNGLLQHLSGLEGLDTIYYNLALIDNPVLVDLKGLKGLRMVDETLIIEKNKVLNDLSGLEHLTDAGNDLLIRDNPTMQRLTGLRAVTRTGNIYIVNNSQLNSLQGFDSLHTAIGITIQGNNALTHADGFPALRQLSGLSVEGNQQLLDFGSGFGAQDSFSLNRLFVRDNASFQSFAGMQHLHVLHNALWVERNARLETLQGLGVARIGDTNASADVYVRDNPELHSLGMPALRTIGSAGFADNSHVEIRHNASLTNLIGWAALDSCHARLWVEQNDELDTVDLPDLQYLYDGYIGVDSMDSRVGPFHSLHWVKNDLSIFGATQITGFSQLQYAGNLTLAPADGDIRGFSQLNRCRRLIVGGNAKIVDGFNQLNSCTELQVYNLRDSLIAFAALDSIWDPAQAHTGHLLFWVYDTCYTGNGFPSLRYISGHYWHGAGTLTVGGDTLTRPGIGGKLPFFPELRRIDDGLLFWKNIYGLTSINVFPQLEHVGNLRLFENSRLESLDGLEHILRISGAFFLPGRLEIHHNDGLADCSALCSVLSDAVINGPILIHDNPFPCESKPVLETWCDTVTAIKSPLNLDFDLFPNPSSGTLHVRLPDWLPLPCFLLLKDRMGRSVWQVTVQREDTELQLPAELPSGMYFLTIQNGRNCSVKKLILVPGG